jgi:hypothetical protein
MLALDPATAYIDGTKLQTAMHYDPEGTRMALVKMVADLVQFIDAKKTLATTDQITFSVDSILHDMPTITLEEVRMAFELMKQGKMGKLYERLKTAEIMECLQTYLKEYRRAMIIQRRKEAEREAWMDEPPRKLKPLNLAAILEEIDVPEPERKGLGTQIRERNGWHKEEK